MPPRGPRAGRRPARACSREESATEPTAGTTTQAAGTAARPLIGAAGGAAAEAPADTIAALELALAQGADALCLRVRLSRDRHPLLFGAARLEDACDGRGRVEDLTVRELKRLDAGAGAGTAFRGQRLQTLQEVLERFRERALLWLELASADPELPERVVGALEIYDAVPRALVASDDPRALSATRRLAADLKLAWLAPPGGGTVAGEIPAGSEVIGLDAPLASRERVAAVLRSGVECYAWNVRAPDLAARMAGWGVAGIVTDRPGPLRARLGR